MTFTAVYAESIVIDLNAAERWYTVLFNAAPDLRPMEGLLTWVLGEGRGVQVWRDPERAGQSAVMVGVDDLDALASRLTAAGIEHAGAEPGGGGV